MSTIVERILAMTGHVRDNNDAIGVLSTGEAIAVALVLDTKSMLPEGYTMLEAIERLGPEWTRAALIVQRGAVSLATE